MNLRCSPAKAYPVTNATKIADSTGDLIFLYRNCWTKTTNYPWATLPY